MAATADRPGATTSIDFAVDCDGVGWITMGRAAGAPNVLCPHALEALAGALALAAASPARALVIRSAQERIFLAGADLRYLSGLSGPGAAEFSRRGQEVFGQIAQLRIPVVCAIRGACAGGGFELALACRWRVAEEAAATRVGMPELSLGTIPGWGGAFRLRQLVGAAAALDHLLTAQLLPAVAAFTLGFVDELAPAGELEARARTAAVELADGRRSPQRVRPPNTRPEQFAALRRAAAVRFGPLQPAPAALIDRVEEGLELDAPAALQRETQTFAQLTASPTCKNLVRSFFLRESALKRTLSAWFDAVPVALAPIEKIGVVGAGIMGCGMAQLLAIRGHSVILRDVSPDCLIRGLVRIRQLCAEALARGKISAAQCDGALARITATTSWEGFSGCDLIIEAVLEDVECKRRVFSEIAAVASPETILASNSSALPIKETAGHVPLPERTLGLHFFNPVSRMPLVELVLGPLTQAAAAGRALQLVKSLGKSPVICRSAPGLLVTRILFFYLNAAVRWWEQGTPAETLDEAMQSMGWPMGPLRLIDEVGLDVTASILAELARYFPDRFEPSAVCAQLVRAGRRGRKHGAGFYRYSAGQTLPNDSETRALAGWPETVGSNAENVRRELMAVMAGEAQRCLDESVARSADDIDFALISGIGFPAVHGGIFAYARAHAENLAASAPVP